MTLKQIFLPALLALAAVGCDSNPTNAPTDSEIKAADDRRAAAIDADASLSTEQKTAMKQRLGLSGGPTGGEPQKR